MMTRQRTQRHLYPCTLGLILLWYRIQIEIILYDFKRSIQIFTTENNCWNSMGTIIQMRIQKASESIMPCLAWPALARIIKTNTYLLSVWQSSCYIPDHFRLSSIALPEKNRWKPVHFSQNQDIMYKSRAVVWKSGGDSINVVGIISYSWLK